MLDRLLAHPMTKGLDLDDPDTTALRVKIVRSKPFLRAVYEEWYDLIGDQIPSGEGEVVELGAGGGFCGEHLEDVITSDVFPVPGVDRVIDARALPFEDERLKAIVMTNVFHHIPDVAPFLTEAQRTLRPGGRIVMVEPWNTGWSKLLHESFHNEPMVVDAPDWAFPDSGPLSAANAALAWVVCERDRAVLNRDWPHLQVTRVEPFMPFRYVLSGGVSLRSLQPGWMYPFWNWADNLPFLKHRMAVFALIVIERNR